MSLRDPGRGCGAGRGWRAGRTGDRRADPASEGSPPGPAWTPRSAALPRASPAVGQVRGGARATHVDLHAGAGARRCIHGACAVAAADRRARPGWGLGHDALVLVGLLALARFGVSLAAWDTAGAFGLMGAARDLMFSVFVEAAAAARARAARAAAAQHRPAGDEPRGHVARSVGKAGALGGGARVLPGGLGRDRPPAGR